MDAPAPHMMVCPITVGREPELATLGQLLALASEGQGQTALIIGEAGIGKSRLAADMAARSQTMGFQVIRGGCFEADRALPYAGLLDLLRAELGPLTLDEVVATLSPLAPHLISLLPEYHTLLTQNEPPVLLDPQQERQRITQAFLQLFAQRVQHAPLLLVIEDLHWGDEATLAVLLALARRLQRWPLLLLITCRDEPSTSSFADLRAAFIRERMSAP